MPTAEELTAAMGEVAASALTVLVVAIAAYLVLRISRRFITGLAIRRLERNAEDPDTKAVTIAETRKRIKTIAALIDWALRLVIITFAIIAVLVALGLDSVVLVLAALLAGVAIVAQDVIRDYVGGAIIVMENQFGIGDWVQVGGVSGEVESLSLRRTLLRNETGDQITVPNGEIRVAINQTRIWARINFEVAIVDPARVDEAHEAIDAAGRALAADPIHGSAVLEAPTYLRVSGIDPNGVRLLVRGRVRAADRWQLNGEFRERVIAALTERGIEVATTQRIRLADPTKPPGAGRA